MRKQGQILALGLIGAGLLLLGSLALFLLLNRDQAARGAEPEASTSVIPVMVDFPAPEITLKNSVGDPVSLRDYDGQVRLVNNWATWCPPCKEEMPALEAYYQAHREEGFVIIAIEAGEPAEEVAAFVRQYRLSFPVWTDPQTEALAAFQNDRLPSSYVLDRTGQVRLAWTGAINLETLEKYVTPLVEQ